MDHVVTSRSMTACSGDGLPDIDLSSDLSVIWIQSLFVDTALNVARASAQHVRGKLKIHTGCLKKNARLCLTGHRGYQKWTINKSRVSFEKFRKFPF